MRPTTTRIRTAVWVALLTALLLVGGCQAGPRTMPDGRYRLLATSTGPVTDDIFLEVAGTSITLLGEATRPTTRSEPRPMRPCCAHPAARVGHAASARR